MAQTRSRDIARRFIVEDQSNLAAKFIGRSRRLAYQECPIAFQQCAGS
jgi:hypothetical protein